MLACVIAPRGWADEDFALQGTYASVSDQSKIVTDAIEGVIANMNFVKRPFARSRLTKSNPIYQHLGQTDTALYRPDSGVAPHVGIIVMHREADYMNNIACTEFAKRGFMVLCMNSRFINNEAQVAW